MYEDLASAPSRVIGVKQTVRALERGAVLAVLVVQAVHQAAAAQADWVLQVWSNCTAP